VLLFSLGHIIPMGGYKTVFTVYPPDFRGYERWSI
jgi:hypothetical protein